MELSRLRAEVARLKRENEIIKKAAANFAKRCSVKNAWIAGNSKTYSLAEMCSVFEVSVSGHRAWQRGAIPGRKRLTDVQMRAIFRAIHAELKGVWLHEIHLMMN
ncbi:hypothetical protein ACO0LF_30955 [Undibacterium sp. Di27W]|uniref:hypothetical protein n=1 Tax=Undibacterium sp. Di27W TaxID=3413036 RepID=UPI003BEF7B50